MLPERVHSAAALPVRLPAALLDAPGRRRGLGCALLALGLVMTSLDTVQAAVRPVALTGEALYRQADVGLDDAFRALLVQLRHDPDRPAPAAWRALLVALRPSHFDLTLSLEIEGEALHLVWVADDCALPGLDAAAARGVIAERMAAAGFVADGQGGEARYAKDGPGLRHSLVVPRIVQHTGAPGPQVGVVLVYKVTVAAPTGSFTLPDALALHPALRFAAVPAPVLAALGRDRVERLTLGGTWTRYYSFEVVVRPALAAAAQKLAERLEALVRAAGAKPFDQSGARQTFALPGDGMVYLDRPGPGLVSYRLQPQT